MNKKMIRVLAGTRGALTTKMRQLESAKRQRFPRLRDEENTRTLRHWIKTDQILLTSVLVQSVLEEAKKQGIVLRGPVRQAHA